MDVQTELTDGREYFLKAFNAKRLNPVQLEELETLIIAHGIDKFKAGVKWAATLGMPMGKAILSLKTALPKWGNVKRQDKQEDASRYVNGKYADFINH